MTKWCEYASERKGRFVGLINKDGTTKTECGIHVAGAEKTFDRDLWDESTAVLQLVRPAHAASPLRLGSPGLVLTNST